MVNVGEEPRRRQDDGDIGVTFVAGYASGETLLEIIRTVAPAASA